MFVGVTEFGNIVITHLNRHDVFREEHAASQTPTNVDSGTHERESRPCSRIRAWHNVPGMACRSVGFLAGGAVGCALRARGAILALVALPAPPGHDVEVFRR